jgi:DNA-binding response OmpR family regulator
MFNTLLIDDEQTILRLLTQVLEMDDFAVTAAGSAREGLALLNRQKFDLVITDLRMESPLAGFDVVRAAIRLTAQPVTVILTAFPVPADEWQRTGADALFVKGSDTLALPIRLKALMQQKSTTPRRPKLFACGE